MSDPARHPRGSAHRLAPLAALLVTGGILAGVSRGSGSDEVPDAPAVMRRLSERFQELRTALLERRAGDAASAAEGLRTAAADLSHLRPLRNVETGAEFERLAGRVPELAAEVGSLARAERLGGADQALFELRNACVTCHEKFRTENERRGPFPAVGNRVVGRVRLRGADGELREDASDVLVFLERLDGVAAPWPPLRDGPALDQRDRAFHPRVLPVVRGTTVAFPNGDTIFHNVFSLSKAAPFDLGMYEPGQSRSVRFDRAGLVKVHCNIHPEMQASVVVLETPHFALTDEAGLFVVAGVPDGRWALRAWNDHGGEARRELSLEGCELFRESLEVRESRTVLTHTNKFGKPYGGKYR